MVGVSATQKVESCSNFSRHRIFSRETTDDRIRRHDFRRRPPGRYVNDYKLPVTVFRLVYTATASSGARVRNFSLHRSFVNNIALYYDAT